MRKRFRSFCPSWGGRSALLAALSCFAVAVPASPAQATFHLIFVTEVYPGSTANPESSYVELQMYGPEQHFLGGHSVTLRGSTGNAIGTFTFPEDLQGSSVDQQTILVGDEGVE